MSHAKKPGVGEIGWIDLTVDEAVQLRDFYSKVVGWTFEGLDMGGYDDFVMKTPENGNGVAGICHRRGTNKDIPPRWMVYITVDDLDESVRRCEQLGGTVVVPVKGAGAGRFCIIRDPAGAVAALYQAPESQLQTPNS